MALRKHGDFELELNTLRAKPMTKIRTCAPCKKPEMSPVSHVIKPFHSVYEYKCPNCGETTEIVPTASIGVGVTVGGLALTFWGFILFWGPGYPSVLALTLFAGAILALLAIWVPEILKHRLYPAVPNSSAPLNIPSQGNKGLIAKLIVLIEKMGFLVGLLTPIAFIMMFLGIAALIGYINFTFFE
mgnify:CR=1 FL=1